MEWNKSETIRVRVQGFTDLRAGARQQEHKKTLREQRKNRVNHIWNIRIGVSYLGVWGLSSVLVICLTWFSSQGFDLGAGLAQIARVTGRNSPGTVSSALSLRITTAPGMLPLY